MTSKMFRGCAVIFLFSIILIIYGIGCSGEEDTLTIGMAVPLTGNGASFGAGERDGVMLAAEEINAAGGINGKKIEFIIEDTKTEPPVAVTAVTKLVYRDKVPVLLGSAASLDVPAYMDILEKAQIPQLLPVAVMPKITERGAKWTFRSAMNDKIAATMMANFVVNELKAQKVALLLEESAFGDTGRIFGEKITGMGVSPLTIETFKRGDNDMSAQLIKIKNLGATHIQFWGYYADYAQIARQIKQLKMNVQLMGNQAPVTQKTIDLGGEALEGAMNVCLFVPTSKNPKIQAFVSKFKNKYGYLPDTWAAQSYDGMYLLADALKKGGTDSKNIRDALAETKNFEGITGTITFNDKGDAEFRGTSIVVIKDGQFIPYKEYQDLLGKI